jgi:serine/threonine protein kinase
LEIELLSKLNHKNVIKYFGTLRTNERLAIFLDYCVGGSIAKLLESYGKFKEHLIRMYTKQILEGLEYLHAHDVIHRGNFK